MTQPKKETPTDRRIDGIARIIKAYGDLKPSAIYFYRDEVAAEIRALSSLGRTERWQSRVENWASMVEKSDAESAHYYFIQWSVWATHEA